MWCERTKFRGPVRASNGSQRLVNPSVIAKLWGRQNETKYMRALLALAVALTALPVAALPSVALADRFEDGVLSELNRIRADPGEYARELERDQADDPADVDEAIAFLHRQPALPPLRADDRIAVAALDHVEMQGPRGELGHGAPGSLGRRLHGHGVWAGLAAETISYGERTPKDVIRQLVIETGVPSRAHRLDLFSHSYQIAGVGCGPHAAYGVMCVIDFAGALVQR
jgi:uncharacterized protein YkwD